MFTLRRLLTAHVAVLLLTVLTLFPGGAAAEKVNMSPDALRRTATDVVVGKVFAISRRMEMEGQWRVTHYSAEVKVLANEKGTSLKKGRLFTVRYWQRAWAEPKRPRVITFGSSGYRGLPVKGQTLRLYLARNAYDGFGDGNHDGGYNVVGANGFEPIRSRPK